MKLSYINNSGSRILGVALLAGIWSAACSSNDNPATTTTTGGATSASTSTGGKTAASTGGVAATGGKTGAGGSTAAATGGSTAAGGSTATATGGRTGAGGSTAVATGGSTAVGGSTAAVGGSTGVGGSTAAVGGSTGVGGSTAAVGGSTAAVGGSTAAVGGSTAAVGGSTAAVGGSTAAVGGSTGVGGSTSTTPACSTLYDFEGVLGTTADLQGWSTGDADVTLAVSPTQKSTGAQSLKVTLPQLTSNANADAGVTHAERSAYVTPLATANLWPGSVITFNVWVPSTATGLKFKAFSQNNPWNWDDAGNAAITVTPGAWTTWKYTVPETILPLGMHRLGVQFGVSGGGTFAGGDVFIDAVSACPASGSCTAPSTATPGSFDWETAASVDSWAVGGNPSTADTVEVQSTDQHFGTTGTGSLKVTFTGLPVSTATTTTSRQVQLNDPQAYCGQTVTFHVYMPTGATAAGFKVQPFSQENNWVWNAAAYATTTDAAWTTITYAIPAIGFLGIQQLGLQFSNTSTTAAFTGTAYVDVVTWP